MKTAFKMLFGAFSALVFAVAMMTMISSLGVFL